MFEHQLDFTLLGSFKVSEERSDCEVSSGPVFFFAPECGLDRNHTALYIPNEPYCTRIHELFA
jgi:hypothetical protein